MFRAGKTYQHMSCLDLGIVIWAIPYQGIEYVKAKVLYVNLSTCLEENRLISNRAEQVKLPRCDSWKWREV